MRGRYKIEIYSEEQKRWRTAYCWSFYNLVQNYKLMRRYGLFAKYFL